MLGAQAHAFHRGAIRTAGRCPAKSGSPPPDTLSRTPFPPMGRTLQRRVRYSIGGSQVRHPALKWCSRLSASGCRFASSARRGNSRLMLDTAPSLASVASFVTLVRCELRGWKPHFTVIDTRVPILSSSGVAIASEGPCDGRVYGSFRSSARPLTPPEQRRSHAAFVWWRHPGMQVASGDVCRMAVARILYEKF